jgi:hypothetical protein
VTPAQLALLERLRLLRERRAGAVAAEAAAEAAAAEAAAERARRMARSFATMRRVQSASVARRLSAGPQVPGRVTAGQAELLDLAARAGALAARVTDAEEDRTEAAARHARVAALHQAELRRLEAWRALAQQVDDAADAAADRAAEAALEEAAETLSRRSDRWTA